MKKWVIIAIILVVAVNIGIVFIWSQGSSSDVESEFDDSNEQEIVIFLSEATEVNAFKEVQLNPFDDA